MFDPKIIRKDFPIYEHQPNLVYLDSAATALKPESVLQSMDTYYREYSANVARGLYPLAERATTALEAARQSIAHFLHAEDPKTIVFMANATHAINLVALGLEETIKSTMNLIVTDLEHHSNYLPWKELARRTKAELRSAPFSSDGTLDLDALLNKIDAHTTIVAFSAISNVLGLINPVTEITKAIRKKKKGVCILIDASQAVGHIPVDIELWDADFVVFSGHKLFGPTGIGVLTGKRVALEQLSEKNVGGGTVLDACSLETEYKELPDNLEGGTPNIAGAIGLGSAIEYIENLGLDSIRKHEMALMEYMLQELQTTFSEHIHILGTLDPQKRAGLVSFTLDGIHPHDLAHLLGEMNICVRAGEQCASPLHQALSLHATTRVSLSIYNDEEDIRKLIDGMQKALAVFNS